MPIRRCAVLRNTEPYGGHRYVAFDRSLQHSPASRTAQQRYISLCCGHFPSEARIAVSYATSCVIIRSFIIASGIASRRLC
jgi:hypothetical protein